MADGTDFAQQTRAVNVIDDIIISELSRIICYNQSIYDDISLEPDEYAGLTLGVIDMNDFGKTTTLTIVEPMYDQAAILIVDNDGECYLVFFYVDIFACKHILTMQLIKAHVNILQELELVWNRHSLK